ncbi:mucolipin-3-like [Halichondria panicea]|uniref:mucolipin-3-like n=1 Tax=Halichondria panicea TaxID=6063 RepID=UPI00312BC018
MARVSRLRAASRHYGATRRVDDLDALEASVLSMDTIKSEEQSAEFSCGECCQAISENMFNFTLGACLNCCVGSKGEDEPPSPSLEDLDIKDIKTKLKFYFLNPFEKWKFRDKRRFPWKLIMQVASIILVTWQVALFAHSKFALNDFLEGNKRTFTQLFVVHPAPPLFSNPVPDPISVIYTNDALFQQLNFTANQYFYLEKIAAGPYGYEWSISEGNESIIPHLHLKIRMHEYGNIDPTTRTYDVSSKITTETHLITNKTDPINSALDWQRLQKNLTKILDFNLNFTVSSVYLTGAKVPKCFQFNIALTIENNLEDGNLPVNMAVETKMSACNDSDMNPVDVDSGVLGNKETTIVDSLVIVVSILSIILCGRSIASSFVLTNKVRRFFIVKFDWKLKLKHFFPLFNMWFVGIIVSNGLVVVGSIMKLTIAYTNPDSIVLVDITSIMIGLAAFGQWCGLLRFLSYFDKYNMLLITLRLAMPSVVRFGVCAGILYISFLLLGWLVLGPYHPKFKDPSTTSECLFSLLNGDDMFATYNEMSQASMAAWVFSKIYLYTFISLFIYVVLSVFISLISDTYETLHDHWRNRQRGLLKDFATDQLMRGKFKSGDHHAHHHSIMEDDAEDYDYMRGLTAELMEANSEHQPLVNGEPGIHTTQPSPLLPDAAGHQQAFPGSKVDSSIQIT